MQPAAPNGASRFPRHGVLPGLGFVPTSIEKSQLEQRPIGQGDARHRVCHGSFVLKLITLASNIEIIEFILLPPVSIRFGLSHIPPTDNAKWVSARLAGSQPGFYFIHYITVAIVPHYVFYSKEHFSATTPRHIGEFYG